jgi:hypothetical protein
MNALEKHIAETGTTLAQIAKRMQRSGTALTRPLHGQRFPSFDLALELERATDGAVTAEEFLEICLAARRRANGYSTAGDAFLARLLQQNRGAKNVQSAKRETQSTAA